MSTTYKIKDHLDKINVNGIWVFGSTANEYLIYGSTDTYAPYYDATSKQTFAVEFVVNMPTGGNVDATGYWGGGTLKVSTDGGDLTTPADNGAVGNQVTIKGSLAAGQHLIRLQESGTVYLKDIVLPTDATIISVARRRAYFPSSVSSTNMPNEASPLTLSGLWKLGDPYSQYMVDAAYPGLHSTIFELATDAHAVEINGTIGGEYRVGVDGDVSIKVQASSAGDAQTMFTGLSGSTQNLTVLICTGSRHVGEVRLRRGAAFTVAASISDTVLHVASSSGYAANEWVEIGTFPAGVEIAQIASVGAGTITLQAGLTKDHAIGELISNFKEAQATISAWSRDRSAKSIAVDGDSRTHASSGSGFGEYFNYDPKASWVWRAFDSLGWNIINMALAGGQSAGCSDHAPLYATHGHGPHDIYACLVGCNDQGGGAVTLTTFKSNLQTMITAWKADGGTGAKYWLIRNFTKTSIGEAGNGNGDTIHDFNTALDELAATNTAGGYTVEVVDFDTGLILGTTEAPGVDVPDGTHPDPSGQKKMAANSVGLAYPTTANVWRGTVNNAWGTAGNWSKGHVPLDNEWAVWGTPVTLSDTIPSAFAGQLRTIGCAINLNASSIPSATLAPVDGGSFTNYSASDTTPPTLSTVTVDATGLMTTNAYSETVGGLTAAEYTLNGGAAAITLSSPTGSGDDSTWVWTNSRVIYKAETTLTENYAGTGTVDTADPPNLLATITGKSVTNGSQVICAVPSGLEARSRDTAARITWGANAEPVIGHYVLYRSTTLGGTYSAVGSPIAAGIESYLDTGLTNGQQYFYRIASRDTAGNESAKSAAVSVTPAVPSQAPARTSRIAIGIGIGI